jgi:hypothetical protein
MAPARSMSLQRKVISRKEKSKKKMSKVILARTLPIVRIVVKKNLTKTMTIWHTHATSTTRLWAFRLAYHQCSRNILMVQKRRLILGQVVCQTVRARDEAGEEVRRRQRWRCESRTRLINVKLDIETTWPSASSSDSDNL